MHEPLSRVRQDHLAGAVGECRSVRAAIADARLAWFPEIGVGYYPVKIDPSPYDQAYFDKYRAYRTTDIGRALNLARVNFVARLYRGTLIDVGIGDGAFIDARRDYCGGEATLGYDVNPAGVLWLRERGLWRSPYRDGCEAASLWDVIEHIGNFAPLLANVGEWVFMSLPIFSGLDHALASKHFRRNEHYWYFTRGGLLATMQMHGFECIEHSGMEIEIGREDIETFAFKRG